MGSARRNGLIVAVGVAVVFAGVSAWMVAQRADASDPNKPKVTIEEVPPPDIKAPPVVSTGDHSMERPTGSKFFAEIADRDDPSRRAGVVRADTGTPGVGGSYILTKPEFLYFTKDGRLIYFTADKGEAYFPSAERGARPESGFFDGHVVFRVFEKGGLGAGFDPATETPSVVGTTARIEYNGQMGEVLAPDRFEVDSDQGRFVGRNALLRLSEARQQLMYAFVDPGAVLTIRPRAKEQSRGSASSTVVPVQAPSVSAQTADTGVDTGKPGTAARPKAEPKLAMYKVNSKGGVVVEQSPRVIRADEARLWLRLVDNKLPVGALGETPKANKGAEIEHAPDSSGNALLIGAVPNERDDSAPKIEAISGGTPARAPARAEPGLADSSETPITISFTGPLEVNLLDEQALELAHDDVLVRFLGDAGHRAQFEDTKARATGSGDLIQYAVTSGALAIAGTREVPATLALADAGTASGDRFDVDLRKGLATIAGPGSLVAKKDAAETSDGDGARTLAWHDGATLGFVTRDGKPTSEIEWFKPRGDVTAADRSGSFFAKELDASFEAVPNAPGKRYLKQMVLRDGSASDRKQGHLEGAEITAHFEPVGAGTNSSPTSVSVVGNAIALVGESTIEANSIEAALSKDGNGRSSVQHATARGDARFDGRDGVWAKAELIEADVPHEIVDLSGPDVRLGQAQTFVQGSQMRLEGGERQKLTVFGLGNFEHEAIEDGLPRHASASWTRQMTFVDSKGELECAGDVDASWVQGDVSRDRARAERVKMWFTPGGEGTKLSTAVVGAGANKSGATAPANEASADGTREIASIPALGAGTQRRLLRAEAIGSISEREDGVPASIESRRYAMVDGHQSLDRLLYVEGGTIRADDELGTLDVPGPGTLFTLDHRAAQARADDLSNQPPHAARNQPLPATLAGDGNGAKGEAKFQWKGSLKAEKNAKTITLHDGVKLRHHRSQDGLLTDLECQDLVATMGEGKAGQANAKDLSGDLKWAMAKGGVWLRSGTREIAGAELLYDASNGLVDALANEGSKVTIFDQGTATPLSAKRVLWNLTSGRLEVREPGTIVAPR